MTAPLVCVGPDAPRIIPLPRDWCILEGIFEFPQQVTIGYRGDGAEDVARYLSGAAIRFFEATLVSKKTKSSSKNITPTVIWWSEHTCMSPALPKLPWNQLQKQKNECIRLL